MQQAIHSERLDRWLGPGVTDRLSQSMRGWYAGSIPVATAPGRVHVRADGDFEGKLLDGGRWSILADKTVERTKRFCERVWRREAGHLNAGFSSLNGLIQAATSGQVQTYQFNKAGPTGVVNSTSSLWGVGNTPAAGAAAGAAPGGTATTSATTGAFPLFNVSTAQQYFTTGWASASVGPNILLLYDRLFHVTKTMSSSATEAVTGTLTRYTNTSSGTADYIGGNFLFVECGGALSATAHNWTVCQYTNQAGTTGQSVPSITGNSSNIIWRLDQPAGQWFAPLATGDSGIKALTQMQCSSASVTGTINFVIGHPIAFIPCTIANLLGVADGVYSAFNLARIFDNACLAMLEITKAATTATTYSGQFQGVYG